MTEEVFEEDNVLDWILEMHHGNTMKNVSRQSLMSMVDNYDYLAVVFCKKTRTWKKKYLNSLNNRFIFFQYI